MYSQSTVDQVLSCCCATQLKITLKLLCIQTDFEIHYYYLLFQAVGIALETRRLDVFEQAILKSVSCCC